MFKGNRNVSVVKKRNSEESETLRIGFVRILNNKENTLILNPETYNSLTQITDTVIISVLNKKIDSLESEIERLKCDIEFLIKPRTKRKKRND